MNNRFQFTFQILEHHYQTALDLGYKFFSCRDYLREKHNIPSLAIVNRVDIDISPPKAEKLLSIFNRLGVPASFFIRLHAPEYNPFSFENYRILKKIRDSGHEIGYHSEVVDQAAIWNEDPSRCLLRDIEVLNHMLEIDISGVASHGGLTGLNNLDFWKTHNPVEFGLEYEAYDSTSLNLFNRSLYISDSSWTSWKCYRNGHLQVNDDRTPSEHFVEMAPLIYLLIHPDTYYDHHIYE